MDKKKTAAWVLCVLLGAVFVFAAAMKFPSTLNIEKDVGNLLGDRADDWRLGIAISVRFLIAFELALGLALLQPYWRKRLALPICLFTLVAFSIYLATLDLNTDNCNCFGDWPPMTPLESLIKNAAMAGLALAALILSPKDPKGRILVPLLGFVVATALTFAIIPPKAYVASSKGIDLSELGPFNNQNSPPNKGLSLICFLNSTCEHCEEASMDLQDFHRKYGMPVFFALDGNESQISNFFEMTGTGDMPWLIVDRPLFFSATGKAPPRYHLVKDGVSIKYWDGKFNPKAVVSAVKAAAKGEQP